MAKRRQTLHVRIPPYHPPRNNWRHAIHPKIVRAASDCNITYQPTDKLELMVNLYFADDALRWHDVDNRLKDIMDALQGRAGGPKSRVTLIPIIPNDHQIHKVIIEKKISPPQGLGEGHLIIRKYREILRNVLPSSPSYAKSIRKVKSDMWTPRSEIPIQVTEKEKRLYMANNPHCLYFNYRWPFCKGRHKMREFPVVAVRKHFIDKGYKVWVSGQSKIGIDAFILAMFPGAQQRQDPSYLNMVKVFGQKTIEAFNAIVEKKKKEAGLPRHGGDPDLFVQNPKNLDERFFVEVKAEDFTRKHRYKDDLNAQQLLVFPLIEKHLKCQVRISKVQIVKNLIPLG